MHPDSEHDEGVSLAFRGRENRYHEDCRDPCETLLATELSPHEGKVHWDWIHLRLRGYGNLDTLVETEMGTDENSPPS
jgi:hypothetical protein